MKLQVVTTLVKAVSEVRLLTDELNTIHNIHKHTLSLSLSSLPGNATGSIDAPTILSPASCSPPTLATTADPNFPNDNYENVMLEYKCGNYDVAVHYFLKTSVSNYVSKVLTIQAKSS